MPEPSIVLHDFLCCGLTQKIWLGEVQSADDAPMHYLALHQTILLKEIAYKMNEAYLLRTVPNSFALER
jgi:hypothetical protein